MLDLFGNTYVLLCPAGHQEVAETAAAPVVEAGVPMRVHSLPLAPELYAADEWVLVRPDGIVAARGSAGASATDVGATIASVIPIAGLG